MSRTQLLVIGSAVVLFLILYFGCETKPSEIQDVEKSRLLASESTDVSILLDAAMDELSPQKENEVIALNRQIEETMADSAKADLLKQLSGKWYSFGHPSISGYYAQEVASLTGTEEAWSIAGTTYTICIQQSQEEKSPFHQ